MTDIERQLVSELLGEPMPKIDMETLIAIDNCSSGNMPLNDLKLAEVHRIARESRRGRKRHHPLNPRKGAQQG